MRPVVTRFRGPVKSLSTTLSNPLMRVVDKVRAVHHPSPTFHNATHEG
ncbi:MAG: hypothetical protein QOD35_1551 [Nocardioidaceae bacterium]|nr:hypothetical protein [Nocardioidaceae bacterium]